jgi:aspartokinase/homoserine dehydrogenase 1
LMGYRGAAPAPESLVPRGLAGGTVQEFYRRMAAGDAAWQARASAARTRHRVLRYMVRATPRSVSAGLREVPIASAAGSLEGTRNLIAFTTERYGREPIVVSGSGAGPAVTAAGVLNDIQSLGRRE